MKYKISTDKLVNQLVPHFFGGRKLVLLLQALCHPLQSINDQFVAWTAEKRIEAAITSQVIMLEWYLNHKMSQYFTDKTNKIVLGTYNENGVPVYSQSNTATNIVNLTVYHENNDQAIVGKENKPFKYIHEQQESTDVSFIVACPECNVLLISKEEYKAMITALVNKYRLGGKTFKLITQNTNQ